MYISSYNVEKQRTRNIAKAKKKRGKRDGEYVQSNL